MSETPRRNSREAAVPVETAVPPVFEMAGSFHRGLRNPLTRRRRGVAVQKAVMEPPDNTVLCYDGSLKKLSALIPANIISGV
jgi:hypothetical protein